MYVKVETILKLVIFLTIINISLNKEKSKNIIPISNETNDTIIKCNLNQCNPENGMCIMNKCECYYGHLTTELNNFCSYKQYCKTTAFFLEFLFPIGAGHLYTRRYEMALIKFLTFMIFFCFICGDSFLIRCKLNAMNKCHLYLAMLIIGDILLWFSLHIADLFCYAMGIYKDGSGIELI